MAKEIKVIPIDESIHKNLKKYCKDNGYIMKSLVEKLIKDELSKNIRSDNKQSERSE